MKEEEEQLEELELEEEVVEGQEEDKKVVKGQREEEEHKKEEEKGGRCRSRDQKLVERTQIPADYGAGKWSKALGVYGYNEGPGGD